MKCSNFLIQVSVSVLMCLIGNTLAAGTDLGKALKRQVGHVASENLETDQDRDTAATAFASAGLGAGKYFQYAHVPAKDHYEFGHRRGNEHHFTERHEKAHPHAGEFKTKVRWGDKHGGYGEHYWDYNHAGHDGHDDGGHGGEETQEQPQYSYNPSEATRSKREPNPDADVEYINESAKYLAETESETQKHGGNYKWAPFVERTKRTVIQLSPFVYEPNSGRVYDQKTGQAYQLIPLN